MVYISLYHLLLFNYFGVFAKKVINLQRRLLDNSAWTELLIIYFSSQVHFLFFFNVEKL